MRAYLKEREEQLGTLANNKYFDVRDFEYDTTEEKEVFRLNYICAKGMSSDWKFRRSGIASPHVRNK